MVSRAARDVQAKFLLRNGADEVVYPEKQLAAWTAIRYSADRIFDYVELDEEHAIFEVAVPEGSAEKAIGQLNVRRKYNINVVALKHDGKMKLNISPDYGPSGRGYHAGSLGNIRDIQRCFHI